MGLRHADQAMKMKVGKVSFRQKQKLDALIGGQIKIMATKQAARHVAIPVGYLGGCILHVRLLVECKREVVLRWKFSKHLLESCAHRSNRGAVVIGHIENPIVRVKVRRLFFLLTHSIALRSHLLRRYGLRLLSGKRTRQACLKGQLQTEGKGRLLIFTAEPMFSDENNALSLARKSLLLAQQQTVKAYLMEQGIWCGVALLWVSGG